MGTLGTARLIGRVSDAVHELRSGDAATEAVSEITTEEAVARSTATGPTESISAAELPIDGYDDLAARQVVDRLGALDPADLARIETYEREHRNRSTVLGKISMLTA